VFADDQVVVKHTDDQQPFVGRSGLKQVHPGDA
jgi:hypothetical protein